VVAMERGGAKEPEQTLRAVIFHEDGRRTELLLFWIDIPELIFKLPAKPLVYYLLLNQSFTFINKVRAILLH